MKNVSFGKEEDFPIPKRNDEDDENVLDLDDEEIEQFENENDKSNSKENSKSSQNHNKELELSYNNSNNKKINFKSDSEDNDSDKTSSENQEPTENNKNHKNLNKIDGKEKIKEKIRAKEEKEKHEKEEKEIEKKKEENEQNEEKSEEDDEKDKNELNKEKSEEDDEKDEKMRNSNKINNINNQNEKDSRKKSKNKEIEDMLLASIKNKENATSEKIHMAEEINFKSIPSNVIITDQYGFLISDEDKNTKVSEGRTSTDLLLINARTEKWNEMIQNYESFYKKKYNKLKSRTRKGVPDCFRSIVWQLFAEEEKYRKGKENLFSQLDLIKLDENLEIVIIKDLDRTFPKCYFFKEKYGNGQRKLYKVLSYYSKYNTSTGYVQGMGFIVAVFLTYMDEESSFFMLDSLMKKYGLEGFYMPGFPKLKGTFYILLNLMKKFVPKIYELFKNEGMMPSMYASEWFICLFSRNLQFEALVRIFDVFLLEGYKVIYRFALAFLKLNEEKFLEGKDGLSSIMGVFKQIDENIDIELLFKVGFSFSLSRKFINNLEKEYENVKNDQKNEFVQQL